MNGNYLLNISVFNYYHITNHNIEERPNLYLAFYPCILLICWLNKVYLPMAQFVWRKTEKIISIGFQRNRIMTFWKAQAVLSSIWRKYAAIKKKNEESNILDKRVFHEVNQQFSPTVNTGCHFQVILLITMWLGKIATPNIWQVTISLALLLDDQERKFFLKNTWCIWSFQYLFSLNII